MTDFLVADIGGTRARFAVANVASDTFELRHLRTFLCGELDSLAAAIDAYSSTLSGPLPSQACLAVAGPVNGDDVYMTNLDWRFSIRDTRRAIGLERLEVMNDLAAMACAVPSLPGTELQMIKPGVSAPRMPRAVIGSGTGLGVAGVTWCAGAWHSYASEGGHAGLAAANADERELLAIAAREHAHLSAEMLLSGTGLRTLYRVVCERDGVAAQELNPQDITAAAVAASNSQCVQTVAAYSALLGNYAGNVALMLGSTGGVYLIGRVMNAISEILPGSDFTAQFVAKGPMRKYLERVPVHRVRVEEPGLVGAAIYMGASVARASKVASTTAMQEPLSVSKPLGLRSE